MERLFVSLGTLGIPTQLKGRHDGEGRTGHRLVWHPVAAPTLGQGWHNPCASSGPALVPARLVLGRQPRPGEQREPRRIWAVLELLRGCRALSPKHWLARMGQECRDSRIQAGNRPSLGGGDGMVQAGCSRRAVAWEEGDVTPSQPRCDGFHVGSSQSPAASPRRCDQVPPPYPASIRESQIPRKCQAPLVMVSYCKLFLSAAKIKCFYDL